MKQIIIITLFLALQINFAQSQLGSPHKMSKKFKQLEKIKLLEILNLDEEIAVRFFTRKNLYHKEQRKLFMEHKNILLKLETSLKKEIPSEEELLAVIYQNENLEMKILQQKKDFINSVKDILTTEQVAKLVLFEYKFKKEIRDLLIKGGKKRFKKGRRNNFD
ncbi:MAG: hypothetical protein V3V16_11230 [Melioribacteraceae bacterium]